MNTVAKQNKIETYIKCKKCGTEVVDGSKDLVRVLGNPEGYEEIQK